MGQKTHPVGFRLGTSAQWQARWFASRGDGYRQLAIEDQSIRKAIKDRYRESGGISKVEIERGAQELVVTIHTARPGIVIGRGGQRVDELRGDLEKLTGKRARLNIQEVRQPELDAYLVGRNIAEQLERRIAFRRAMRQAVTRTVQAGAQGIKVICSGRLGGAEIARSEKAMEGRVPLHTLRANVDFAIAEAATTYGRIGVKVWIYKGDVLPGEAEESARHTVGAAMGQQDRAEEGSAAGTGGGRRPSRGRGASGRSRSGGGSRAASESAAPASGEGRRRGGSRAASEPAAPASGEGRRRGGSRAASEPAAPASGEDESRGGSKAASESAAPASGEDESQAGRSPETPSESENE